MIAPRFPQPLNIVAGSLPTPSFGLGIAFDKKNLFFNVGTIADAADKAAQGVLSRAGAFIMRRARKSMKRPPLRRAKTDRAREKIVKRLGAAAETSPPGTPPYRHTGLLHDRLFFAYDPRNRSVVIGPEKTNQIFFNKSLKPGRGTVPGILEFGGELVIFERRLENGTWIRQDLRRRKWKKGTTRYRTITIKPRPYMRPAFDAELPKFPSLWANSIRPTI